MSDTADARIGVLSAYGSPLLGYTLQALIKQGLKIGGVILDAKGFDKKSMSIWNDRTQGRLPSLTLDQFEEHEIPTFFVSSHNSPTTAVLIKKLNLSVLVNGGTPTILKKCTLESPNLGVLNIHPGRLPDYRGCTCVEWAIFNNEQIYNSVHFMVSEIDAGPIVIEEGYRFGREDRYVDIREKVYRCGFDLLARGARRVIEGHACPTDVLSPSDGGAYYKPIGELEMDIINSRLATGEYRYQDS